MENSLCAAEAAIDGGYAIECDVQVTADGDAVVFHDFDLDRLTAREGAVSTWPRRALEAVALKGGTQQIPGLDDFLARIAGRVPVICEIKSRFDGDLRLAERVGDLAESYDGPLAIKSFDPEVIVGLRARSCSRPLGIVCEARFDDPEWNGLSGASRHALANLLHFEDTRPDFLSYHVADLPHAVPYLCRAGLGLPVLAWTVRTPADQARAAPWSDQIVFEGFPA